MGGKRVTSACCGRCNVRPSKRGMRAARTSGAARLTSSISSHLSCITAWVRGPGCHTNSPGVLVHAYVPRSVCGVTKRTAEPGRESLGPLGRDTTGGSASQCDETLLQAQWLGEGWESSIRSVGWPCALLTLLPVCFACTGLFRVHLVVDTGTPQLQLPTLESIWSSRWMRTMSDAFPVSTASSWIRDVLPHPGGPSKRRGLPWHSARTADSRASCGHDEQGYRRQRNPTLVHLVTPVGRGNAQVDRGPHALIEYRPDTMQLCRPLPWGAPISAIAPPTTIITLPPGSSPFAPSRCPSRSSLPSSGAPPPPPP